MTARRDDEPQEDRTTTTAERILDALNAYEQEQRDAQEANVWQDVIYLLAGGELDEEATQAEDPAATSAIAVFKDGSAARWLQDERRWVAEVRR